MRPDRAEQELRNVTVAAEQGRYPARHGTRLVSADRSSAADGRSRLSRLAVACWGRRSCGSDLRRRRGRDLRACGTRPAAPRRVPRGRGALTRRLRRPLRHAGAARFRLRGRGPGARRPRGLRHGPATRPALPPRGRSGRPRVPFRLDREGLIVWPVSFSIGATYLPVERRREGDRGAAQARRGRCGRCGGHSPRHGSARRN